MKQTTLSRLRTTYLPTSNVVSLLIFSILTAVAGFMTFLVSYQTSLYIRLRLFSVETTATVIDRKTEERTERVDKGTIKNPHYETITKTYYRITYQYVVKNESVQAAVIQKDAYLIGEEYDRYPINTTLKIKYLPNKPDVADPGFLDIGNNITAGIFLIVIMGIVDILFVHWLMKSVIALRTTLK